MDAQQYNQMQKTLNEIENIIANWNDEFCNVDYASSDAMCQIEYAIIKYSDGPTNPQHTCAMCGHEWSDDDGMPCRCDEDE